MIKISKPVLPNDFLLSSVQFTSLNSIFFKNVKNIYEGNEKISLDYEHSSKIKPSSRDWIGLFPRGWSTLQQYVTFEWVSQSLPTPNSEQNKENADLIRRTINFCPKYHVGSVSSNTLYQFVYISKQIEVLGVSIYFRFDTTNTMATPLELECLVPISTKLHSSSVSDFGILLGNNISSSTSLETRSLKTSSIHSLQNLDLDNKNWTKTQLSNADAKKPASYPRKTIGTGDSLDPYSSHSEPVFPMSFQLNQCKKCFHFKRGGEFLRSQQVLQSKVGPRAEETSGFGQMRTLGHEMSENKLKIVMERNKVLEERAQEMKKEMERLQAESKKLKMSFYNVNKEKVAYEKFVKDFIKSLEKDSIVRVVNGNTEILVKKVNYVGMEEHPRGKKTSKRERELKAVIGLQEITIRNLINSLQEKAKSVQELNQTVKLAQAFSSAGEEVRGYNSDADETADDASNSDVTSEYEFSLTKPPPPEEDVIAEDADAVLDDIRRTTETELKDIGINRSLGKSSSRDTVSESSIPNLSVCRYQNQNEGTRPKKPRLFDNVEDCWPFSDTGTKTIQRKVLEDDAEEKMNDQEESEENTKLSENQEPIEADTEPVQSVLMEDINKPTIPDDTANFEDYYDAYEDSEETQSETDNSEKSENKESKNDFLVTAIIPQDMKMEPTQSQEKWMSSNETEKKVEPFPEKGKKFTCEFSIDFGSKPVQRPAEQQQHQTPTDGDSVKSEQVDYSAPNEFALVPSNCELNNEKSLLTLKKSNKCVEIKITQVDQKENSSKKCLQQNLILKFANDSPSNAISKKPSKFEFNLALTGLGCMTKPPTLELSNEQKQELEAQQPSEDINTVDNTPRTVWNDASDEIENEDMPTPELPEEVPSSVVEDPAEEKQSISSEEMKEESTEIIPNAKSSDDSLRYEKNLEYLQQKTDERVKKADEEIEKSKPSAILIQDGQTKLALIRY